MSSDSSPQALEAERAELEHVVKALAKWPRLSNLLRYIGEKFFAGEVDRLNEYDIATEVLGRSKTVFNAAEDAIARVETHRLRKRLAQFYETEGKDHPIQVTLPTGNYIPVFVHVRPQDLQPTSQSESHTSEPPDPSGKPSLRWSWKYWVLAASLVLAAAGFYLHHVLGGVSLSAMRSGARIVQPISYPAQSATSTPGIRILVGYSGPPRTDSAGRVWNQDQYFTGGGTWSRTPGFIARTSDPFLFDKSRTGDFYYNIPLKPGSYELHLFFSTHVRVTEAISTFNVSLNGQPLLQGFDINADALGEDIADERVFRDVSPGPDGVLRLAFSGAAGPPTLNAIEILPGMPHAQLPVRLTMQNTALMDRNGQFWHPDDYFMNGRASGAAHPLLNSADPDLFSGERYGHFTYAIPVDTRGHYTLILHFAEFYFGSGSPATGGVGGRVFKVMCNGQDLLDNFDIFKEAGSFHEITKTFRHLKPTAQGKLNLTFEPIVNNASVSGIEVLDESL